MPGTVLCGAGDVRFEEVPEPKIISLTDTVIRNAHASADRIVGAIEA